MWSRISSLLTSLPSGPAATAAYIQYLGARQWGASETLGAAEGQA